MTNILNPLLRAKAADSKIEDFCGITEKEYQDFKVQSHLYTMRVSQLLLTDLLALYNTGNFVDLENIAEVKKCIPNSILFQTPQSAYAHFLSTNTDDTIVLKVQACDLNASVYAALCFSSFKSEISNVLSISCNSYRGCLRVKSNHLLEQMIKITEAGIKDFEKRGFAAFIPETNSSDNMKAIFDKLNDILGGLYGEM